MDELYRALAARCAFDPIRRPGPEALERGNVSILGLVPEASKRQWMIVAYTLLTACHDAPWKADISKHLRLYGGPGTRMVYAWRLILQAPGLAAHLPAIVGVIRSAPRPRVIAPDEIDVPLPGATAHRNSGGGPFIGKGAISTSTREA